MPKCEKCDREFKSDFSLKIHVGRMHGGKKAKAGKGTFACEACGRKFKLPAHLGRHVSVAHAKAGKVKKARKVGRPAGRSAVAAAPVGLAKIPASILQAELQRRANKASKKLRKLSRQRAKLDAQIAELETLTGGMPQTVAEAAPKVKRGRKPGRKPAAKVKVSRKRKTFPETAEQFVRSLAKYKGATTAQINDTWKAAGRGGKADKTLGKLVKAGKLKREKLPTGKGSRYTLA
jgi:hypothetical protein